MGTSPAAFQWYLRRSSSEYPSPQLLALWKTSASGTISRKLVHLVGGPAFDYQQGPHAWCRRTSILRKRGRQTRHRQQAD
jgi:hypothetical protein